MRPRKFRIIKTFERTGDNQFFIEQKVWWWPWWTSVYHVGGGRTHWISAHGSAHGDRLAEAKRLIDIEHAADRRTFSSEIIPYPE